jgi:hypothetical protein
MQRRQFTAVALLPGWAGAGDAWALTESDAAAGIRDALRRAAGSAVASLGRNDGFLGNAQVRIGLPPALERAGDTAACDFFARKTRVPLSQAFLPVVQPVTERLALAWRHDELVERAARLGLAQGQPRKVHEHVTDKALDGVFLLLAQAERELRADPLAAGSALLKRVFGR